MFSSALKSFTSNITSNYTIAPQPSSTSGPWKIFDAKRKSTGKAASVFVFEKKTLEPGGGGLHGAGGGSSRHNAASLRRLHEEVLERLKKEASSLARLRHPSILELAEPVEETRYGGLMFATEPVTASLASLLQEKDDQERSGGVGGRGSRYVVEEADGTRKRRELEIDELEIQKGLLQLGKGLEFLHESAGLVHANLSPEAVMVNAKGDWKISGLAFCGPHEASTSAVATSIAPIQLSEVLNHDPRLPRAVQLNLDYTSPDFVLDNRLTPSADIFSLGLLILAMYNSPHASPLSTSGSLSAHKRLFSSTTTTPTQNNNFLVPASHPLPPKLASDLLPRLLTRRPAQRLSAKEFQEASYFDNILVSTIRFLDALPAKTPGEKAQFMRGLPRIMPQFPKSVLEKKVLPALLEECKDRELLAPILTDAFAVVKVLPTGKRAFTDLIVPKLREVFLTTTSSKAGASAGERDTRVEAGLMVLLENISTAAQNCPGKEFRDDILPLILLALESPTHTIVDAALGTLPSVLPVLDYSTIKNDLFPSIAAVFAKTSSLNIKIRGLEAFYTLCGGSSSSAQADGNDDLNGLGTTTTTKTSTSSTTSSAILDKHTIQTSIVPLLRGIKTREPGVMMASLRVFRQVGQVADTDFLAMEVLPVLWSMSLGPLLDLEQFQKFMDLIRKVGERIEGVQVRKLRELGVSSGGSGGVGVGVGRKGVEASGGMNGLSNGEEVDFENLVSGGRKPLNPGNDINNDLMNSDPWSSTATAARPSNPARSQSHNTSSASHTNSAPVTFSWQTPQPPAPKSTTPMSALRAHQQQHSSISRAVTPDQPLSAFAALQPASTQFSQPLQPSVTSTPTPGTGMGSAVGHLPMRPAAPQQQQQQQQQQSSIDWSSAASQNSAAAWAGVRGRPAAVTSQPQAQMQTNGLGFGAMGKQGSFALSPPPIQQQQQRAGAGAGGDGQGQAGAGQKSGLDRYESLL